MDISIIVAIIGASATILAAIITGILGFIKRSRRQGRRDISQTIKGNNNIQINIENSKREKDNNG